MYDQPQFEIPAPVREIAERNVAHVRQAYEQFMSFVTKAQETMLKSQGAMTTSAVEIQAKTLNFTQANIEAYFRFCSDMAKARDLKDCLEVQSHHTQSQLETFGKQAQEISRLMGEAAHKSQPQP